MRWVSEEAIAEHVGRGHWTEETLVESFDAAAARAPDREALADPPNRDALVGGAPRRMSWREVERAVASCASGLSAEGLTKDDVLVLQLPNILEQPIVMLAAMRLGVVITPVAVQFREHELKHVVAITKAKLAITTRSLAAFDHLGLFAAVGLRAIAIQDRPAWFDGSVEPDRAALAAIAAKAPIDAHDVVTICWTSGTEGVPKGVPRNHNEWRIIGDSVAGSVGLAEGCRLLNPFPLVNMGGIGGVFAPWILRAGALIQHHPFALPVFLEQLRTERADYTVVPPPLLNAMMHNQAMLGGIDFGTLSRIGSGSAPLSPWMVSEFAKLGVGIVNYFGSNEGTTLMSTPEDLPDPAERAGSFPRFGDARFSWSHPLASKIASRLVDPANEAVIDVPNVPGELRLRGPAIFAGYYGAPELQARTFDADGFYRTGDLFEIAGERGELYRFVGRLKDIVIRGGVNVSPEEIERLLQEHPAVAEVAIIGVPDERLGEKVCAVVVAKPEATPTLASLVSFLKEDKKVAAFKLPERLEVVSALPRNPLGKILKTELRARFH